MEHYTPPITTDIFVKTDGGFVRKQVSISFNYANLLIPVKGDQLELDGKLHVVNTRRIIYPPHNPSLYTIELYCSRL